MAFKAFAVLVALCLVSLASGFVAPTAVARNVAMKQAVQMSAKSSLPAAAVPAAALGAAAAVCSPLASFAADPSSALAQLPTELLADNGTATLAIVVGMFIPCSFLITLYFGTEQKKKGVIEGQEMNK
ncbi:expressed unknown protein [Ectocarpus siliculosus]|uniref:PSII 6.1 kDa protein n=1 Tax=Ectocarpus siliculosus TaxID=2880 RepID=D7G2H7_ECTSI|nr:expressed unknown protein [Ectocarpus siliculosus]|eukprot:CBJ33411.1 expressed unknown protein [Ectocarpus siliculosus]